MHSADLVLQTGWSVKSCVQWINDRYIRVTCDVFTALCAMNLPDWKCGETLLTLLLFDCLQTSLVAGVKIIVRAASMHVLWNSFQNTKLTAHIMILAQRQ